MKFIFIHLTALILGLFSMQRAIAQACVAPPVGCTSTDYSNAFIHSTTAATLEYDNIVSGYHSTGVRRKDGKFFIWGSRANKNGSDPLLVPTEINNTNFPLIGTSTPLKYTVGSNGKFGSDLNQHVLLTTDGLYTWGYYGHVFSSSITGAVTAMKKLTGGSITTNTGLITGANSYGLPGTLEPKDVKMLQGSYETLTLVTCDGRVFVISETPHNTGTGSTTTASATAWHQVQIASNVFLTNVVASRSSQSAMLALTSDNSLYTWGIYTYLGAGAVASRTRAVKMTAPSGTIKMIGVVQNSLDNPTYYVLMVTGELYSLGANTSKQIGDFTTTTREQWVRVKSSTSTNLENIAWISPNEHDGAGAASISAITKDGVLWNWGDNDDQMLARSGQTYDTPPGSDSQDPSSQIYVRSNGATSSSTLTKVYAVETGGHASLAILECEDNYAYAGHSIDGSYGDNTSDTHYRGYFEVKALSGLASNPLQFCGIDPLAEAEIDPFTQKVCAGNTYTLTAMPQGGTWSIVSGSATINPTTGLLSVTGNTPIVVKFTNTLACSSKEDELTIYPYDWGNLDPAKWDQAAASVISTGLVGAWAGTFTSTERADAECTTATADEADGLVLTGGSGQGTLASPWAVRGNSAHTFTLEMAGTQTGVQYGVWIDIDDDGHFTGTSDIYAGGFINLASNVGTASIPITFPNGITGIRGMRVLVGGQTENPAGRAMATWTKADMINGFTIQNGEVEDYYLDMQAVVSISGNVFNDLDALDDDDIAQTGSTTSNTKTNAGNALYANLLDESGNVVASVAISSNGTYNFDNVVPGTYTVQLTINQGTPTQPAPVTKLPDNWVNTGEKNGVGTGVDGTSTPGGTGVNGVSAPFTVSTTNVNDINFGIEQLPTPNKVTLPLKLNPGGSVNSEDVASSFGGTDPDLGMITAIKITSFPTGATSITINGLPYTDLAAIQAAYPDGIPTNASGQPTVPIMVDPTDGDVTVNIPYVTLDNAGFESPTIGFVEIPFATTLPVKLVHFDIVKETKAISIQWSTVSEENFKGFQIERSANAKNWNTIKIVDSKGVNGQSDAHIQYTYQDSQPLATVNYYRLKMVDLDDTYTYSTMKSVHFDDVTPAYVYPNPVQDKLYLKTTQGENKVTITNMLGQIIWNGVVDQEVDFSRFAAGLYIISIKDLQGQTTKQKIVKH